MDRQQQLLEWIKHPETLGTESLYTLRTWLTHYPYFQTARLLYLKNLYLLQDPLFREELRKSSLYMADLSVLFYTIEGERFRLPEHAKEPPGEMGESDRTLDLIERFLAREQAEDTAVLPLPTDLSPDYTPQLETSLMQLPDMDQPEEMKGQALIDRFIDRQEADDMELLSVQTPTSKEKPDEDLVVQTEMPSEEEEGYFTETLAKIYIKQQRYEKALEIIKKLNLKYPKKNTYFADQIRFLEKLIINAKSK